MELFYSTTKFSDRGTGYVREQSLAEWFFGGFFWYKLSYLVRICTQPHQPQGAFLNVFTQKMQNKRTSVIQNESRLE